jgi:HD-GYP domain-containing protein (c-di-GMP phosphodiesterase class II)
LDFDLFAPSESGETVLFRGQNYPLSGDDIRQLGAGANQTLFIREAEHKKYREYLKEVVLQDRDLPATQRVQGLTAVNRSVFESAVRSPNVNRYVEFANDFGENLTVAVCDDNVTLTDMMRLMSHDDYPYTHVANVATYCLTLARARGIEDRDVLRQVTVGALLHDYGKRFIPASILNTTGRLTDEQWLMVEEHPVSGFRAFSRRHDLNWGQLMMIYQHHERLDGQGYPTGVAGPEIHEWARMCKVADVFDALTSDRPYRRADSPAKVIEFMESKVDIEFDGEMVRCLRAMINY